MLLSLVQQARVKYAYQQAVLVLRHYECVWIDLALFLEEQAKAAEARGDTNMAQDLFEDTTTTYVRVRSLLDCLGSKNLL